jgi:serine/threonine-protein kinase
MGLEEEYYYLVIEYVPGKTLKQYMEECGVISPAESIEIAIQICDALMHAHDNGIIHRDIKPQNILWYQYGKVKVADFGLCRFASEDSMHTQPGSIMGSIHYLSPEQLEGKKLYESSDLYSLGIVLYECLTGETPFSDQNGLEIALQHLSKPVPSIKEKFPELPEELDQIIQRLTSKDPQKRYLTARELKGALLEIRKKIRQSNVEKPSQVSPELPPSTFPASSSSDSPPSVHVQEEEKEIGKPTEKRNRYKILLAVLLIPLVIGGIVYGIFGITLLAPSPDSNETSPNQVLISDVHSDSPNKQMPEEQKKEEKTKKKKEPNKEKENNEKETNQGTSARYYVFAGSFQNIENAKQLVKDIGQKTGIRAKIVKAEVNGQTFYRVQTGLFTDIAKAEEQIQKLQKAGFEAFKSQS